MNSKFQGSGRHDPTVDKCLQALSQFARQSAVMASFAHAAQSPDIGHSIRLVTHTLHSRQAGQTQTKVSLQVICILSDTLGTVQCVGRRIHQHGRTGQADMNYELHWMSISLTQHPVPRPQHHNTTTPQHNTTTDIPIRRCSITNANTVYVCLYACMCVEAHATHNGAAPGHGDQANGANPLCKLQQHGQGRMVRSAHRKPVL